MSRYTALAPLYVDGRYIEIGQTIGDENNPADIPIPTSYIPSPACMPLNASALAKLTATITINGVPHSQPGPSSGVIGLWGIRAQFQTLPLPTLTDAWKALVHP